MFCLSVSNNLTNTCWQSVLVYVFEVYNGFDNNVRKIATLCSVQLFLQMRTKDPRTRTKAISFIPKNRSYPTYHGSMELSSSGRLHTKTVVETGRDACSDFLA